MYVLLKQDESSAETLPREPFVILLYFLKVGFPGLPTGLLWERGGAADGPGQGRLTGTAQPAARNGGAWRASRW